MILAATHPLDSAHMVLIIAGNDALSTVKAQAADFHSVEYAVLEDGEKPIEGFQEHGSSATQTAARN